MIVSNVLGVFSNKYVGVTGRLSTMSYPHGQLLTNTYYGNTGGERLQEILYLTRSGSTISKFDYAYDSEGEITNWTQQTGTTSVYNFQYDAASQLVEALQSGASVSTNEYAYDAAGNRLSERTNSVVEGATYNNVNELTNRTSSGPLRFRGSVNEPISNATVAGTPALLDSGTNFTGYANVSPGSNTVQVKVSDFNGNTVAHYYSVVLSNGTSQILTYDLNGNLVNMTNTTTGASTRYAWDAANRLVHIYINGTYQTEFLYDGLGRRMYQAEDDNGDNTISWMLWSGTELCEERDEDGTVMKRFFPQGEWLGGANYFTRDHLGSIREMMDDMGTVHARYSYDPWGRRTTIFAQWDADFGFTGHYYHAPSGLDLTLHRAYSADLGRWLSRDPAGDKVVNLYDYVNECPIGFTDSLGLMPLWVGNLWQWFQNTWDTILQAATECCKKGKGALTEPGGSGVPGIGVLPIAQAPNDIIPGGYEGACIYATNKAKKCYETTDPSDWEMKCDPLAATAKKICDAKDKACAAFGD